MSQFHAAFESMTTAEFEAYVRGLEQPAPASTAAAEGLVEQMADLRNAVGELMAREPAEAA